MILNYTKTILNTAKLHKQLHETFTAYTSFLINGSSLSIEFSQDLSESEQNNCDTFIANFVDYTTADQLAAYLEGSVTPFVKLLINTFASENISMGITQAGKTGAILGIFTKPYDIYSNSLPISLKNAFDTGSLYEALTVIQYIRDNPSEFNGMSPYITDARLLQMKNKIETFLGLALSV